ncbi:MAG: twin-arginine translocase TatA/TatE family subunit [Clostridiales bacterium]|nr:twin-arginine translocase TatA/TatE family subunit [Clostridiales bacterium]
MKIGVMELIVIFIVALVVLGPDKLPEYARKLGAALGEFRKATTTLTSDIKEGVFAPLEEAPGAPPAGCRAAERPAAGGHRRVERGGDLFPGLG